MDPRVVYRRERTSSVTLMRKTMWVVALLGEVVCVGLSCGALRVKLTQEPSLGSNVGKRSAVGGSQEAAGRN